MIRKAMFWVVCVIPFVGIGFLLYPDGLRTVLLVLGLPAAWMAAFWYFGAPYRNPNHRSEG